MPQFETTYFLGQIFWFFISFGFLYLMMAGVICPILEEIMQGREHFIQSELEQAEVLNRQADIIHQRQQLFLVSVEKEKNDLIQKAMDEAEQKGKQIEAKNETTQRRKIKQAEEKIKKLRLKMITETNRVVSDTSDQLVKRLDQVWRKG